MGRLQDKIVLVTGASRGYGAAIALGVAKEGAHVAVHYNSSREGAEEVAEQIRAMGRQAYCVQANITVWDDIKRAVAEVEENLGPIDVLVNNVGDVAVKQMSWKDITEEYIDYCLAVDIKGTMLMMHEVGLRMVGRKKGSIVNIGSHVVINGSPRAPQYAAAKYGVIGLTKSYAGALGPYVRVNNLAPGFIETEKTKNRPDWKGGRRDQYIERTAMKHVATPEELVGPVIFLACDDSINMTGTTVIANDGYAFVGA